MTNAPAKASNLLPTGIIMMETGMMISPTEKVFISGSMTTDMREISSQEMLTAKVLKFGQMEPVTKETSSMVSLMGKGFKFGSRAPATKETSSMDKCMDTALLRSEMAGYSAEDGRITTIWDRKRDPIRVDTDTRFVIRFLVLTLTFLVLCGSSAIAKPEVVLNIPEYTLRLIDDTTILKEYDVAVGTSIEQTPVGKFFVTFKEVNPTWYPASGFVDKTPVPPGPDNPLGSRWIEFAPAFGIHGTHKVWTVDYPVSGGCVRMYNPDVEELYELVDIGTPVTIIYETITLVNKKDGLYVRIFPDIYERKTTSREKYLALITPLKNQYRFINEPVFPMKVNFAKVYDLKIGIRTKIQ